MAQLTLPALGSDAYIMHNTRGAHKTKIVSLSCFIFKVNYDTHVELSTKL